MTMTDRPRCPECGRLKPKKSLKLRQVLMVTGAQIRAFRISLDWSQAELAYALGVQVLTVLRWENNQARPLSPALDKLHRLALANRREFL